MMTSRNTPLRGRARRALVFVALVVGVIIAAVIFLLGLAAVVVYGAILISGYPAAVWVFLALLGILAVLGGVS